MIDLFYIIPFIICFVVIVAALSYALHVIDGLRGLFIGILVIILFAWTMFGAAHFANAAVYIEKAGERAAIDVPIKVNFTINCLPDRAAAWCESYGACCSYIEPDSGEQTEEIEDMEGEIYE